MSPEYGVTYLSGRTKEFANFTFQKSGERRFIEQSDQSRKFARVIAEFTI
jgi:hypothetical protein